MALPVFFPSPVYVRRLHGRSVSVEGLCRLAGVECRALGNWVKRPVVIRPGKDRIVIRAEPGDWGTVEVTTPDNARTARDRARLALGALAYSLFDGVARASIAGRKWSRAALPPGRRPGPARAKSSAERQREYQARITSK